MKKRSLSVVATALILAGCGSSDDSTPVAAAAPQATPVTVASAVEMQHAPTSYHVGRMQAIESANLTPRTTGFLLTKHFEDGSLVEKGDVLFEIDPTSYQAALDAAEAALDQAVAALNLTELNHKRNENMMAAGGMSQAQLDVSAAELTMARSRVDSAKANIVVQQDNLDQTLVRAPYSGQLGKSNFSIGDMVGPNFGPLTDIIMMTPIEASFSIKETEIADFTLAGENATTAKLELDGVLRERVGNISFVDNKVNPTSGTISISATFDNEDGAFLPNQFVRVALNDQPLDGVMIPHEAIHQDQTSQYVLTIENGNAERRAVIVNDRIDDQVFVSEGLTAGEPVIVGGLQRIRPGAPVTIAE